MNQIFNYILYLFLLIVFYQLSLLLFYSLVFIYKYFLVKEVDYKKRYGNMSYVIITGASSGQGRVFAHEYANRNFNLILIGSQRTKNTINSIKNKYPKTKIKFILKDFRKAYEKDFFEDIEETIEKLNGNISILVNNVGHRVAWAPYHNMPSELINSSIIVGTIVQSQMSRIVLPHFIKRNKHSAIINITAQCTIPTFGFGEILSNEVTVPFLSVYEGANAFGFYQANSLFKEYKKYGYKIDFLNVMPGAVITKNTQYLKDTIFSVSDEKFVKNIMKLLGNFQGNTCAYWGHSFSTFLINLFPFLKQPILHNTGLKIVKDLMNRPVKTY